AILTVAAGISALQKVCDYMLHGKLVCHDGDHCAFGHIAQFETVADKHGALGFLDKIDNDFSMNLLLAPHALTAFASGADNAPRNQNYLTVRDDVVAHPGCQGYLIRE